MGMNQQRACIYTCVMGGYETLNELDENASSEYPRYCFTDDPSLTSDTWTVRLIERAFPMDSVRSQRRVKIMAHEYLPEFDVSLYIDNSVALKVNPEEILEAYLDDVDMAVPSHSFHSCVLDEFIAVADHGLDEPARIFEQLNHYQLTFPDVLFERPFWTAILLRRHNEPAVRQTMVDWNNQVMRYSRRDQLSLNVAVIRRGLKLARLDISNQESWFHQWPILSDRRESIRRRDFAMSGMSSVGQKRQIELELESVRGQLEGRQSALVQMQARMAAAEQELQSMSAERNSALASLSTFESTLAWKLNVRLTRFMSRHPRLRRLVCRLTRGFSGS